MVYFWEAEAMSVISLRCDAPFTVRLIIIQCIFMINKTVTNCNDCPFLNVAILNNPNRVGHPNDARINCRLQPDVIKSHVGNEEYLIFATCPIKMEPICVQIIAPNLERSVATDPKSK